MPATYNTYTAKNGEVISYQDSVEIGTPSGRDGFRYITVAVRWESADNVFAGRKLAIKSIRSFRRGRLRNKIFMQARADGVYPLFIDYEMALEAGEIKSNN